LVRSLQFGAPVAKFMVLALESSADILRCRTVAVRKLSSIAPLGLPMACR
jgi:hypothetical protein